MIQQKYRMSLNLVLCKKNTLKYLQLLTQSGMKIKTEESYSS